MSSLPSAVQLEVTEALEEATGFPTGIERLDPVSGGCVSHACALWTDRGERFFLKWNPALSGTAFSREAEGLAALGRVGAIRVPNVVASSASGRRGGWILMEYVPRGRPARGFWQALGEGMARLHTPSDAAFGWDSDNHIGSLIQVNTESRSWSRFWMTRRIVPQLEAAQARGLLDSHAPPWPQLLERLPSLLAGRGAEGASLLHGDFWSGNVYPDERGRPVLVDPAVYRGDAEVDLAMAALFGGFSDDFVDAYRSSADREAAPDSTRDLYQLYPLLVHLNLFGGGYAQSAARLAERLVTQPD